MKKITFAVAACAMFAFAACSNSAETTAVDTPAASVDTPTATVDTPSATVDTPAVNAETPAPEAEKK